MPNTVTSILPHPIEIQIKCVTKSEVAASQELAQYRGGLIEHRSNRQDSIGCVMIYLMTRIVTKDARRASSLKFLDGRVREKCRFSYFRVLRACSNFGLSLVLRHPCKKQDK